MRASDKFLERMLTIDPAYGVQQHQRLFMDRIDRCHELAPCPHDHEHDLKNCYPEKVVKQVAKEQLDRLRGGL